MEIIINLAIIAMPRLGLKVDAVPGRLNQLRVEMKTSQFKIAEFALCLRIVFFGFNFFSMVTRCKTLFILLREFYSY